MDAFLQVASSPPVDGRRVLAVASLFDGAFSFDWVQELEDFKPSEILLAVDQGVAEGLLVRNNPLVFDFGDPKRREALREMLTPEERERLHRKIVKVLIRELPNEKLMTLAVAGQLVQISNDLEGCRWLFRAGKIHRRAFRRFKALKCFIKVLEDLERLDSEEADRLFIDTAIHYSKVSVVTDINDQVVKVLELALDRAKARGDLINQFHLEHHLSKFAWYNAQYKKTEEHYYRADKLADAIDDPRLQHDLTIYRIIRLAHQGRYRDAFDRYYEFMPEVDRHLRGWFPQLAGVCLGQCMASRGLVSQALGMLDRIRTYSREMGNDSIACEAGYRIGIILLDTRRLDSAIQYLDEALNDSISGQNLLTRILILIALAYGHYLLKNIDRSVLFLNEYYQLNETIHHNARQLGFHLSLAWAMALGRYPPVHNMDIRDEIKQSIRSTNAHEKGLAYRNKALMEIQECKTPGLVLRSLNRSLHWLKKSGHRTDTARTQLEIGRHYLALGEMEKARSVIKEAAGYLKTIDAALIPPDLLRLIDNVSFEKSLLQEIFKLGKEVVSIREAKHLVQHIISTVNWITGAERGAIFLLDKAQGSDFVLRASKNLAPEDVDQPDFKASMEIIRQAALTGDGRVSVMENKPSPGPASSKTIRSCICVPLILRNKVVGVLYHDNCIVNNTFKESDLEVLAYFAGLAAIALDNADAYEQVHLLNQRLLKEKQYYEEQHLESVNFEDIVGRSDGIRGVLAKVDRVAGTNTTVLILGETGVGKELVARAIHRSGERCEKPFIRVHCSALPESLISSELFGHEKGAFTGASDRRIGRFELAHGGTLFLDEIGELPLEVQVRLLRVLQTKEFERVGGSKTLRSDFRLIVATNRDLEHEVRRKRFRQDLFYRVAVFPIVVPPLRERKGDIPLLAGHFLKVYAHKMGKGPVKIKISDMGRLTDYSWPGNVRELENVIERGIILSTGTHFRLPELATRLQDSPGGMEIRTLRENEWRLIQYVLQQTKGRVQGPGGAAELLDINPNTLKSRIKKLGIKKP